MKKEFNFVLFIFLLILFSCNSKPGVKVIKTEFVESLWVSGGGMPGIVGSVKINQYEGGNEFFYQDHDIIKLTLNFNFQNIDSKEQLGSEAHRRELYKILIQKAQFYIEDSIAKNIWGYWPEKTTETSAKNMVLFYAIPKEVDKNILKFEYDKSILGSTSGIYNYNNF